VPKVVEQQLASKTTRTSGVVLDDDSDIGEAVSDKTEQSTTSGGDGRGVTGNELDTA
jgi:hypothetical protein